jgi:hypothetical protein
MSKDETKVEEKPKVNEKETLLTSIEKNEKTLVDELKDIENKKKSIHDNIHELSNFYMKLKADLLKEEQNIEEKRQQIMIDKEKLKNENEISLLGQDNVKLEKYLQLLEKKQELELKYLEQCCDHKSKIQKIGEKYSFIDVDKIVSLENLYKQDLHQMFHVQEVKPKEKPVFVEKELHQNESDKKEEKIVPPPPAQRRHTIASITKNDAIVNNANDMRINGSLHDHLKNALNTKYKALRHSQDDSDGSF